MMSNNDTYDLIANKAEEWHQALIEQGMPVTKRVVSSSNKKWRHVPLTVKDWRLTDMLKRYHYTDTSQFNIPEIWDEFVDLAVFSKGSQVSKIKDMFSQVFPDFYFGSDVYHPVISGIQFLYLASLEPGRTKTMNQDRFVLYVDGKRIGIDRTSILNSKKAYRNKIRPYDCSYALRCGRGKRKLPTLSQTSGSYALLIESLPERKKEIDVIFNIAVRTDRYAETLINDRFDIIVVPAEEIIEFDPLEKARELIETSKINPIQALYRLLVPLYGAAEFTNLFGKMHDKQEYYDEFVRERHIAALERLDFGVEDQIGPFSGSGEKVDDLMSHLFGID